jgi:hypothetical protein
MTPTPAPTPIGPSKPNFVQGSADTQSYPSILNYNQYLNSIPNTFGGTQKGAVNAPTAPAPAPTPTGPNPADLAQQNVTNQQNALRSSIDSGFNDIFGQLDKQAGLLPGWQQQDEQSLNDTYSQNTAGLNDSLSNANKSIDLSKQQVQTGVNKSVSDIQNNLRSLLKSTLGQVGAVGAGSSSVASQTLPYAFSKMYAQQRGNIQGQANSQFVDLDKKALDVQSTFNAQKMQLDQQEQQNMQAVRDKYHGLLTEISNARVQATGQRAQALSNLQANLLQQAQSQLASIQQEAANNRQMVQQWALQRASSLQQAQQTMGQSAQYTPQQLQYQQLQGGQLSAPQQSGDMLNAGGLIQKKPTDQGF